MKADFFEKNNMVYIQFESAPSENILNFIKSKGLKYDRQNKWWYEPQTEEHIQVDEEIPPQATAEKSYTPTESKRCCYSDTVENFLKMEEDAWLKIMISTFPKVCDLPLGKSQIEAWRDCFQNLQKYLPSAPRSLMKYGIVFEYTLAYESGRRPDVLLISDKQIFVLEFKMKNSELPTDIDQVAEYARDIKCYHSASWEKDVVPILVLTKANIMPRKCDGDVLVCSANHLVKVLEQKIDLSAKQCDLNAWLEAKYEPSLTIIESAKKIWNEKELPNIKNIAGEDIEEAVAFLNKITNETRENKKHVLALVTGAPGSGKTFLGLKYVYEGSDDKANAVYLSGNGALITVLKDALEEKTFVNNVHTVINEHLRGKTEGYKNNILVFDEGQRAWDKQQMYDKKKRNQSEAEVLVDLAEKELSWAVLLILVGEGQEIYNGENSGIKQWNDAIRGSKKKWEVVCPQKIAGVFDSVENITTNNNLNLTQSIRSQLAGSVAQFVNYLIEGSINKAKDVSGEILKNKYNMYITRDLETAKKYCRERYAEDLNKRYGMIASSKACNLKDYCMKSAFRPNVAKWYNAPVKDSCSCCQLSVTLSEFDCQGLEVDMPIIGWGNDMVWSNDQWKAKGKNEDELDYRVNSYRVLLTQGRDGFIIFVPPVDDFNSTYDVLLQAGIKPLEEATTE